MRKLPPSDRISPVQARRGTRKKAAPSVSEREAPGYYTGDHKPSVAEPGPASVKPDRDTR